MAPVNSTQEIDTKPTLLPSDPFDSSSKGMGGVSQRR